MNTTHYDRLEIPFHAPVKLIKKAYRKQARKYHPDRHPPNRREWAREQFQLVEKSYRILSDPRERALYDRELVDRGTVPIQDEEFWDFWRQFLSERGQSGPTLSYHEKMVMDSYEEDWLEEMYGGIARDRHRFRKHLNFGKMQLAQNNLDEARKEFIRAETTCRKNILSKFYVGYCLELREQYDDALTRYEFAVDIGLSRPREYVNKCLKIRERMVELYEQTGRRSLARKQKRMISRLQKARYGFDRFLEADDGISRNDERAWVRQLFGWIWERNGV